MLVLSSGNSPLWGCDWDRLEMVVKVHCGTVLGGEFTAMLKCVLKKVPQCTLTTISSQSPTQPQSGEWRPNSRALGTVGSVMTSLLKNRCSHLENQFDEAKQDWLVQMFGLLFSSSFKNTTGGSVRRVTFPILVYFSIVHLIVLVVICRVGFWERSRCFGRWTADFSAYEWSWRSGRRFAARSNTHAGIELFLWCNYRQVVNRSLNVTA